MNVRNYEYAPGHLVADKMLGTKTVTEVRHVRTDDEGNYIYKDVTNTVDDVRIDQVSISYPQTEEVSVEVQRDAAGRLFVGRGLVFDSGYRAPSGASQRNETYFALVAIALASRRVDGVPVAPPTGYHAPAEIDYVAVSPGELSQALGFDVAPHLTALAGKGLIVVGDSWDSPRFTRFRLPFSNGLIVKVYETRHVNGAAPTRWTSSRVDLTGGEYRYESTESAVPFDASGSAFTAAINGAMA